MAKEEGKACAREMSSGNEKRENGRRKEESVKPEGRRREENVEETGKWFSGFRSFLKNRSFILLVLCFPYRDKEKKSGLRNLINGSRRRERNNKN